MAKVKFTKTELKRQRDMLKQFKRFLPTLQLKKQQLQAEVMQVREAVAKVRREEQQFDEQLERWIGLFGTDEVAIIHEKVTVQELVLDSRNIAGLDVPVFDDVKFHVDAYDLFGTPRRTSCASSCAGACWSARSSCCRRSCAPPRSA